MKQHASRPANCLPQLKLRVVTVHAVKNSNLFVFHLFILNCKIGGRHLKRVFQVIYNNYEIIFNGYLRVTATETCNSDKLK